MLIRAHGTDTVKRHVECLRNVMSMASRPPKEALVGLDPARCTVGDIVPKFNEEDRLGSEPHERMSTNGNKTQKVLK